MSTTSECGRLLALSRFQERQLCVGRAIVDRARKLGAYVQAQLDDHKQKRVTERHRTPESVVSETAVDVSS